MIRTAEVALLIFVTLLPQTGDAARPRISPDEAEGVYSKADIEKEIIFGREMAAIILANHALVRDEDLLRYINLVGNTIVRQTNRPDLRFYFAAIESAEINAYAAPGGYIFVTRGALRMMRDESELAAVLAHEIGHVTERHIVKRLKIREDDKSMVALFGKILGKQAETVNVVFRQAVDDAVEMLFRRGLDREDEYDADKAGLFLSYLAGYDPAALSRYLARIQPVIEGNLGEMTVTHPSFTRRIERIDNMIRESGLTRGNSAVNRARFEKYIATGE